MRSRSSFVNAFIVLLALSPIACLLIVWNAIPETIKVRFNLNEPIVEEQSRGMLVIVTITLSIIAAGVFLLMRNLKKVDPKVKPNTPASGFTRIGLLTAIFVTLLNYLFIFSAVYSWEISERTLLIFGGLLFALFGNYMSSIKPNFFAGIRLPWTLSNESNWRQTHHLAGRLWFAGGILLALLSWLLPESVIKPVFISVLIIIVVIPAIYSYRLFKAGN
jgi:uncharacterized membrane protein